MANSAQARKRARQAIKRKERNASQRSTVRTYIKKVIAAVSSNDSEAAKSALVQAIPVIDKMVSKGILHKNQAARYKSRLSGKVKALALSAAS